MPRPPVQPGPKAERPFFTRVPLFWPEGGRSGGKRGPSSRQLPVGQGQPRAPCNGAGPGFLSALQALFLASVPWHWIRGLVTCQVPNKQSNSGTGGGGRLTSTPCSEPAPPAPTAHGGWGAQPTAGGGQAGGRADPLPSSALVAPRHPGGPGTSARWLLAQRGVRLRRRGPSCPALRDGLLQGWGWQAPPPRPQPTQGCRPSDPPPFCRGRAADGRTDGEADTAPFPRTRLLRGELTEGP